MSLLPKPMRHVIKKESRFLSVFLLHPTCLPQLTAAAAGLSKLIIRSCKPSDKNIFLLNFHSQATSSAMSVHVPDRGQRIPVRGGRAACGRQYDWDSALTAWCKSDTPGSEAGGSLVRTAPKLSSGISRLPDRLRKEQ